MKKIIAVSALSLFLAGCNTVVYDNEYYVRRPVVAATVAVPPVAASVYIPPAPVYVPPRPYYVQRYTYNPYIYRPRPYYNGYRRW